MKKLTILVLAVILCLTSAAALAQEGSVVYMTKDISAQGLMNVYQALGRQLPGKVAVKMHLGEPGNDNYLKPEFVKELVLSVNGTFVECNTYFGGARTSTDMHLQVAKDHGFVFAPVDIMDAEADVKLPIDGGKHKTEAYVGAHYADYDSVLSLTHYKGHGIAGIGGTFKNIGMGMASKFGKSEIHNNDAESIFSTWGEPLAEKLLEYVKAMVDAKGAENFVYINVLNNITTQCDCESPSSLNVEVADPVIPDIGILASTDPVALEKASFDLVSAQKNHGAAELIAQMESLSGTHQMTYGAELGLGSMEYQLVSIDQ